MKSVNNQLLPIVFINTMVLIICIFCASIPFIKNVQAQSPASVFDQANKMYIEKKYGNAIELYEKIVKTGDGTFEIYFNLGNAYYKTANYPASILNYERAKRLKPLDADIEFNLRLANLNTIDKIEPAPEVFYVKWWNDFLNSTSIEDHAYKSLIFLWAAFVIAAVFVLTNNATIKRLTFFVAVILLVMGIFTLLISQRQYADMNDNKSAVIYTSSSYVKSSPDENSTNLFMLHGGTRVTVIDELQGWKRIRIANGNEGWIAATAIEII